MANLANGKYINLLMKIINFMSRPTFEEIVDVLEELMKRLYPQSDKVQNVLESKGLSSLTTDIFYDSRDSLSLSESEDERKSLL